VLGKCGQIFCWILYIILADFAFTIFIASQEVNDTSYMSGLISEVQYQRSTRVKAALAAHVVMNLAVILFGWLYTGILLS